MAKANSIRRQYCLKRKALAGKLGEPKLMKISMRTFRHWKATMEYHRTKDILYVKELLGHHSIKNTLIYTHLVEFEHDDQFVVKVAKSLEEYTELLELGFSYVSDFDGIKVRARAHDLEPLYYTQECSFTSIYCQYRRCPLSVL